MHLKTIFRIHVLKDVMEKILLSTTDPHFLGSEIAFKKNHFCFVDNCERAKSKGLMTQKSMLNKIPKAIRPLSFF